MPKSLKVEVIVLTATPPLALHQQEFSADGDEDDDNDNVDDE